MAKKRHYSSMNESGPRPGAHPRLHGTHQVGRHKGAMINDDMSAPALLPQHVIEKYYPSGYEHNMHMVDDLYDGVQKQLHEDGRDFRRAMSPKKW
jgi:hypothetical protein